LQIVTLPSTFSHGFWQAPRINATLEMGVSQKYFEPMSFDSAGMSPGEKAVTLMQPAFIRVMDHLRNTLERSDWAGQYETVHAWPEDITPEEQAEVLLLYDRLAAAKNDAQQAEIEDRLQDLPQPVPVYLLHLTQGDRTKTINLWELCYQICLLDYTPHIERTIFVDLPLEGVRPDHTLFDASGEVDWHLLDLKTAQVIHSVFESLDRN
jgi:hypothetical protein